MWRRTRDGWNTATLTGTTVGEFPTLGAFCPIIWAGGLPAASRRSSAARCPVATSGPRCHCPVARYTVRCIAAEGRCRYGSLGRVLSLLRQGVLSPGAWHRPSSTAYHTDSCFAATYRSNSYGARDRERSVTATAPRALFLGDSFIEGYGVDDDKRLTALLEQELGFEMLNFGSAEFGPLQYAILYERLARRFDHDLVVVGVLPANDFVDNDLQSARGWMAYRPYYAADGGVTYVRSRPSPDEPTLISGRAVDLPEQRGVLRNAARLFWLYGVYRQARYQLILLTDPGPSAYVGYFETDRTRIANATRSLLEIGRSAAPRPVLVVFMPDYRDLRYVEMHPGSADASVVAGMRPELERNGIKTIDLVKEFTRRGLDTEASYRRLYLPCDGHWNDAGNRAAAEVLQPVVGDLLRSAPRRR